MLSNSGIYGIRACEYLALQRGDIPLPTKKLSAELDLPYDYLVKILQRLKKAGLVVSRKGSNGGVILARPASEIYLFDIIQSSNPSFLESCKQELPEDGRAVRTLIFTELEKLSSITIKFLKEISLEEFVTERNSKIN